MGADWRARDLLAARRSDDDGAGGAEVGLGVADFAVGAADLVAGGVDFAPGRSDLIGKAPAPPSFVASSCAAACKSSKHGSLPSVALQRARARR